MLPDLVIPHGLRTLYWYSLITLAQDKPYHDLQTILNQHSRDQLLKLYTSFYKTISSELLVQGNFNHTQFSWEHWYWQDSNSQPFILKASTILIELTWLLIIISTLSLTTPCSKYLCTRHKAVTILNFTDFFSKNHGNMELWLLCWVIKCKWLTCKGAQSKFFRLFFQTLGDFGITRKLICFS